MKQPTELFPARLHVVLAQQAKTAVVFRRGPSKRVATFLWNRSRDTFRIGQWLKGRIYERRSDLSSDGHYLIYFAMNGKWHSKTWGAWTAVSRAPYLKALDLYAKGDCWDGGGLFLSRGRYWLNDRRVSKESILVKTSPFLRDEVYRPDQIFGSECTGVYYPRLLRDGWTLTGRSDQGKWNAQAVFEKPLPKDWILRKIAHEQVGAPVGKACYWDEHELVNRASGALLRFPDWEWAEWDQRTLVWAEKGKLFRAQLAGRSALEPAVLLHDFNDYRFEPIEAPY